MAKRISYILALVLLSAFAASAQVADKMRLTVPFSFTAASSKCPAGDYTMQIDRKTGLVTLSSWMNSVAVLTNYTGIAKEDRASYARFRRYGGRWFLNEVVVHGTVEQVIPSKMERQLAKSQPNEEKIVAAKIDPQDQ